MPAILLALLYIGAFHYAYVDYINPTFEYAHYTYIEPTLTSLLATYFFASVVILAYRKSRHPAQVIAGLVYVLVYVPTQLSILFTVERGYSTILFIQFSLALSMVGIFLSARWGGVSSSLNTVSSFASMDRLLGLFTVISIATVIISSQGNMRLVSFEEVYDLRFGAANQQGALAGYLGSWLSYCFISYFFARALTYKKWSYLALGILGALVIYMSTGAKSTLLLLPMTFIVFFFWKDGPGFLTRMLFALTLFIFGLVLLPDEGLFYWAKSLVMARTIGNGGWVASKYFEYFDIHGFTYYTHIGVVSSLTGFYPFGEYSLGQLIGLEYVGNSEANFNANFWASDGFAALGVWGIYVVTLPVMLLLYIINQSLKQFHGRFAVTWLTGFSVVMLNVPLATALLSGGGGLVIFFAKIFSHKKRKTDGVEEFREIYIAIDKIEHSRRVS